jgi:hypothetical protein
VYTSNLTQTGSESGAGKVFRGQGSQRLLPDAVFKANVYSVSGDRPGASNIQIGRGEDVEDRSRVPAGVAVNGVIDRFNDQVIPQTGKNRNEH